MEPLAALASHEVALGVFLWIISALRVASWALGDANDAMSSEVSLAFAIAFGLSCLLARDVWRRWHRSMAAPPSSGHPYR